MEEEFEQMFWSSGGFYGVYSAVIQTGSELGFLAEVLIAGGIIIGLAGSVMIGMYLVKRLVKRLHKSI